MFLIPWKCNTIISLPVGIDAYRRIVGLLGIYTCIQRIPYLYASFHSLYGDPCQPSSGTSGNRVGAGAPGANAGARRDPCAMAR